MSGYKGKWPYEKLAVGDWVCCGGLGLFPAITRAVTGGGIRHLWDRKISTHTGIIVGIGEQFLVAEMTAKGITISSLETKYRKATERVMCFRRPVVKDRAAYQAAVMNGVGELYRRGLEYDFKGLLEFVLRRVEDSKKRMYCSELVCAFASDRVTVPFPKRYSDYVSPEDLHTCPQAETIWTP